MSDAEVPITQEGSGSAAITPGPSTRSARPGAGRGRRPRLKSAVMAFNGRFYRMDLDAIERAYTEGLMRGKYDDLEGFGERLGVSRSTVHRFLSGAGTSPTTARKILDELGLRFADVAQPYES